MTQASFYRMSKRTWVSIKFYIHCATFEAPRSSIDTSIYSYYHGRSLPSYWCSPGLFSHPGTWIWRKCPLPSGPVSLMSLKMPSTPVSTERSAWELASSVFIHYIKVSNGEAFCVGYRCKLTPGLKQKTENPSSSSSCAHTTVIIFIAALVILYEAEGRSR